MSLINFDAVALVVRRIFTIIRKGTKGAKYNKALPYPFDFPFQKIDSKNIYFVIH